MSLPASATETASQTSLATVPTPDHILQAGFGSWACKTLLSAVEMEVFTELAKHPEDLEDLTGRLGLHPRSARDFLDALVAMGFLERRDGIYSNTPATDLYLDKKKPSYIGGILEMCNLRSYGHWNTLIDTAIGFESNRQRELNRRCAYRGHSVRAVNCQYRRFTATFSSDHTILHDSSGASERSQF